VKFPTAIDMRLDSASYTVLVESELDKIRKHLNNFSKGFLCCLQPQRSTKVPIAPGITVGGLRLVVDILKDNGYTVKCCYNIETFEDRQKLVYNSYYLFPYDKGPSIVEEALHCRDKELRKFLQEHMCYEISW
jgi:hypothetical protein